MRLVALGVTALLLYSLTALLLYSPRRLQLGEPPTTQVNPSSTQGTDRKPTAWVTMVSSVSYMDGVYALYGSISRFEANKDADFVVVTTCGVDLESYKLREEKVKVSKYCGYPWNTQNEDSLILRRLSKLLVFNVLEKYEKIVYVDADIHFLKSPLALLTRRVASFGAVPGQASNAFNSGLFVVNARKFNHQHFSARIGDMVSCSGAKCTSFVDRMSKSADDQGFLNEYFRNNWERLPHAFNTKLMFYLAGKTWSIVSKPTALKRKNVVGLHWIGPSKPWRVETWYPCGNTKKYCACTRASLKLYRSALNTWYQHYQRGKHELSESSGEMALWSNETKTVLAKTTHEKAKHQTCQMRRSSGNTEAPTTQGNLSFGGTRATPPMGEGYTAPCVKGQTSSRSTLAHYLLHGDLGEGMSAELRLLRLCATHWGNKPVLIDVGANAGDFTIKGFLAVAPAATVHLLEPLPMAIDALQVNIKRISKASKGASLNVHNAAAADQAGDLPMFVQSGAKANGVRYNKDGSRRAYKGASLGTADRSEMGKRTPRDKAVMVKVVKLDDWLPQQGVTRVDFAKFDCEGFDLRAVLGMETFLKEGGTDMVYFEYDVSWKRSQHGDSLQKAVAFLDSIGFATYLLGTQRMLPLSGACWEKSHEFWKTSNAYSIRRSHPAHRQIVEGYAAGAAAS